MSLVTTLQPWSLLKAETPTPFKHTLKFIIHSNGVLNKIKEDQGRSKKEELSKFEAKNQEKETLEVVSRPNGNNSKIALAHFRIANLEQIIKDIQVHHQADKEVLDADPDEHKRTGQE
ncbi:hypothetical protein Tco_1313125 [Tanacetum coccineum]